MDRLENLKSGVKLNCTYLVKKKQTSDTINQQKIMQEEQYWPQIFQRLIALVRGLIYQTCYYAVQMKMSTVLAMKICKSL